MRGSIHGARVRADTSSGLWQGSGLPPGGDALLVSLRQSCASVHALLWADCVLALPGISEHLPRIGVIRNRYGPAVATQA